MGKERFWEGDLSAVPSADHAGCSACWAPRRCPGPRRACPSAGRRTASRGEGTGGLRWTTLWLGLSVGLGIEVAGVLDTMLMNISRTLLDLTEGARKMTKLTVYICSFYHGSVITKAAMNV